LFWNFWYPVLILTLGIFSIFWSAWELRNGHLSKKNSREADLLKWGKGNFKKRISETGTKRYLSELIGFTKLYNISILKL
jgi:hypothetical protein